MGAEEEGSDAHEEGSDALEEGSDAHEEGSDAHEYVYARVKRMRRTRNETRGALALEREMRRESHPTRDESRRTPPVPF